MLVTVTCGPIWSNTRAKRCRIRPAWNSFVAPLPKFENSCAVIDDDHSSRLKRFEREREGRGRAGEVVALRLVVDAAQHDTVLRRHRPVQTTDEVGDRVLVELLRARAAVHAPGGQGGIEAIHQRLIDAKLLSRVLRLPDVRTERRLAGLVRLGGRKEVELVLDDRAAERAAVLPAEELRASVERDVRDEVLVAGGVEPGPRELVGAVLGDRADQAARETALGHVVRRDDDLVLLDRLERDAAAVGLATELAGVGEAELVVLRRAVHLDRVEAVVLAGDRDFARIGRGRIGHDLRRQPDEVLQLPIQRRQAPAPRSRK
ncbi:MAG: hypothetical protein V9E87_05335 [Gemmatimonadales bacterium]